MTIDNQATKVVTGKVRLNYANIWEPKEGDGGALKYSAAILIPKEDKETLRKIKAATEAAKELG
ncbi:ssDNA-binding protein, partial [Paenibacillus larvae]